MTFRIDPLIPICVGVEVKKDDENYDYITLFNKCKEFLKTKMHYTIVTIHDPADPLIKIEVQHKGTVYYSSSAVLEQQAIFNLTSMVLNTNITVKMFGSKLSGRGI